MGYSPGVFPGHTRLEPSVMARRSMMNWLAASAIVGTAASSRALAQPADLLPDITVDANTLYDNVVVTTGATTLLHLSNGTPNIGAGKLYLPGVEHHTTRQHGTP